MKIGVDIDDTLTNFSDIYYSELQKWMLKKLKQKNWQKPKPIKNEEESNHVS